MPDTDGLLEAELVGHEDQVGVEHRVGVIDLGRIALAVAAQIDRDDAVFFLEVFEQRHHAGVAAGHAVHQQDRGLAGAGFDVGELDAVAGEEFHGWFVGVGGGRQENGEHRGKYGFI
jgi:hypothetical protein